MRINQSDINFVLLQRSQQSVENQSTAQTTQSTRSLPGFEDARGETVTVDQRLAQEYQSELYSRLSSQSSIVDQENQTRTELSYESLIMAVSQGLMEEDMVISGVSYANTSDVAKSLASLLDQSMQSGIDEVSPAFSESDLTASAVEPQLGLGLVNRLPGNEAEGGMTRIVIEQQGQYTEESYSLMVSRGKIELADGRSIDFRLELERGYSYSETQSMNVEVNVRPLLEAGRGRPTMVDPLVINLEGNPEVLSSSTFSFDIDADGEVDTISRLNSGAGFLALDLNDDGKINDGNELFGTQSGDGFADLAQYDLDENGWIDEADDVFHQLQIWQPDELGGGRLISLAEAGVGAIYLGSGQSDILLKDEENNILGNMQRQGLYLKETGEVGSIQHIDFAKQNTSDSENAIKNNFDGLGKGLNEFRTASQGPESNPQTTTSSNNATVEDQRRTDLAQFRLARLRAESKNTSSIAYTSRSEVVTRLNSDAGDKAAVRDFNDPNKAYDSQPVNAHKFQVFADDSSLTSKETNTKLIIDQILRPMMQNLQEQIQEKRKLASITYQKNDFDFK